MSARPRAGRASAQEEGKGMHQIAEREVDHQQLYPQYVQYPQAGKGFEQSQATRHHCKESQPGGEMVVETGKQTSNGMHYSAQPQQYQPGKGNFSG